MAVRPIDANAMLNELRPVSFEAEHSAVLLSDVSKMMREWVERQPTLTQPNEWVSVEDRLPDSQADVLVVAFWHENWQTMIGWHSDTVKKWRVITPHGEMEPGGVTHWMPLPAPPGEDNNVPTNKPLTLEFDVVDTTTGKYPDWERITIEEPWANRLVDCDMDGIAIREDGSLILLDEYGNCVSCTPDRFEIRRPPEGEA